MTSESCLTSAFEILLMLAVVVGVLLGAVGGALQDSAEDGRRRAADLQLRSLQSACNLYMLTHLEWPETLADLTEPDPETGEPFLAGGKVPLDPWGNEFLYELGPDGVPVIVSYGKDGAPGGTGPDADLRLAFQ